MIKYFIISLFIFTLISCRPENPVTPPLNYQLNVLNDTIQVSMQYQSNETDTCILQYGNPFFGGMKDQLNSLKIVRSSHEYIIDSSSYQIKIIKPDSEIQIEYNVVDTHLPEHRVVGEMFRPILTEDYIFALSNTLFLHPVVADSLLKHMQMSVKTAPSPVIPLYFTFAPEALGDSTIIMSWEEGLNSLIMGARDIHIETRELGGIMNYIVLRITEDNGYNLDRFMNYFDAFMPAMTNFWGKLNGEYYSLIAAPFVDIDYHKISGTAFHNGFHVKYSGDTVLIDREVVHVISHEIMHRYIGAGSVSLGENHQWFDEGFTDFTTLYLLEESGLISREQFDKKLKETYDELSVNPENGLPNAEVAKHFWDSKNHELIPYQRGALFAAYLNRQMINSTGKEDVYKQLMRVLKSTSENQNQELSIGDFLEAASSFLPQNQVESALNQYIMEGEMIPKKLIFGNL